jgi:hypothetical protein
VEELGAGSRAEGAQALAESALELVGSLDDGLRRRPSARVSDTPPLELTARPFQRLPPPQKIDQYTENPRSSPFVVPARREVQEDEDDGHRRRDE